MIKRALHIYKNSCPYDCVDFKALMPGANEREVGTASLLPLSILKSVPLTEKLEDPCSAGELLFPSSPVSAGDNVIQRLTPFLMSHCRQLSDITTQLPICSEPRQAGPTAHVAHPLVPVGSQSTEAPDPAREVPAPPVTAVKPTPAGSGARHICRSPPCPPSKASLWGQQTFPTLLMLVWDRRSGFPNQISDEQGSSRSQGTGTNFGYAVVSSFPSSSSFSSEYYYFWLNHLRVICRHWWLKRLQIYFLRARQSSKWPQSSNHIEDAWALI